MKFTIRYSEDKTLKKYQINSLETIELEKDNDTLDFDFLDFSLHPFTKNKIFLILKPKKEGSFRIEKFSYKIFGIPKDFDFNNYLKRHKTSANSSLKSL